jgi:hypothetical protein
MGKIRDADREKHRCYCLSIDIALLGIILTQTNQQEPVIQLALTF